MSLYAFQEQKLADLFVYTSPQFSHISGKGTDRDTAQKDFFMALQRDIQNCLKQKKPIPKPTKKTTKEKRAWQLCSSTSCCFIG